MRAEFAPRERTLQAQGQALKAKQDKLQKDGATMTEDQRQRAEKELRDGERDFERARGEFQDDVNARRNEEMSRLQRTLVEEVRTYAKAQNYDRGAERRRRWSTRRPTYDITPAMLAALQAHAGHGEPGSAAPPRRARPSRRATEVSRRPRRARRSRHGGVTRGARGAVRLRAARRPAYARRARRDARRRGRAALAFSRQSALPGAAGATRAAAVVLDAAAAADCPTQVLVSDNPYATYARIAAILHPQPPLVPGVHATALVAASARIDPSASVGAFAMIGEHAVLGARALSARIACSSSAWRSATTCGWSRA